MDKANALKRALHAHTEYEKAEGWRAVRNVAILQAHDEGATQTEIAEHLGIKQQTVSSILARTGRGGTE